MSLYLSEGKEEIPNLSYGCSGKERTFLALFIV
jgi:hypothetical protein